jgi:hypothetical protein
METKNFCNGSSNKTSVPFLKPLPNFARFVKRRITPSRFLPETKLKEHFRGVLMLAADLRLLTVQDYHRMVESGILAADERVELTDEISQRSGG